MPNRDRRGPLGEGPRTGRGLGLCNKDNRQANDSATGLGRGLGCRRGMGRGWRNWFRLSGQTFGRRQQPVDGTANSFNKDELDKELIKLEQEVELLKKKLASLEK